MHNAIYANWKSLEMKGKRADPEVYIPLVMSREDQVLAYRIWRETNINPRNSSDAVELMRHHHLVVFPDDVFTLTEAGKLFMENDESILAKIDHYEGILIILAEVAAQGPAKEGDFLRAFQEFFRLYTTFSAKNSGVVALRHRLENLRQRDLVEKTAQKYSITDSGLDYLRRFKGGNTGDAPTIEELVKQNNAVTRRQLSKYLQAMDPFLFEHFIKLLLEEMGYHNVEVTAPSNDKGIDVVAEIELGISRVREVIQVKRQKGNVGRPILDQLRGSLHYFQAVRGSIITTGGFAKSAQDSAFAPSVAPITLIDGERLLNLLIEHNIGIRRREIRILEFDAESLSQFESEGELNPISLEQPESE